MRLLHGIIAVLALAFSSASAMGASQPTSVAVLPFAKMKGDKTIWLDKAIADLVAQKLAESPRYAVLNRDALQSLLKEMEFEQSGFVEDTEKLSRVGRIAKTDQVLFGNYTVEARHITITLQGMTTDTKVKTGAFTQEGNLSDLITLTEKLALQVIEQKGDSLTANAHTNIAFTPTSSLTALEHFYEGINAYDNGQYEEAMGSFLAATQQDPQYLDAKLWLARMLEQLGKHDQAIITYKALYLFKPQSTEGIDAQYFAARLLADKKPEVAIALLHTLSSLEPPLPQSLEAAYVEAGLQRRLGNVAEAYRLYKLIDDEAEKRRKHSQAFAENRVESKGVWAKLVAYWWGETKETTPAAIDAEIITTPQRQSRFFNWKQATAKYREAITNMVELYAALPAPAEGMETPTLPRGSFLVDVNNPVISGDVKNKDATLFGGDHTFMAQWKEMFYALILPKGYVATGIDLEITGQLPDPAESKDFTIRVMPFPLKENYQNSWLGVIFGQTPTTTTLTKHIPFFGKNQSLLALQLVENSGRIDHWQVKVKLEKQSDISKPEQKQNSVNHVDGALIAKVRLGNEQARTIRTQPQYIMQWQPKQKLALANNFNDGIWLVGVKGDLLGEETNLWQSHSEDGGVHWSASELLSVNSGSQEYAPALIRREDGQLQFFFLSDRRGLGWELWTSTQNRKDKHWSHPRLVPLRDFAATGFEEMKDGTSAILPYSVMQDNQGRWLVGFYSRITQKIHIVTSMDLDQWKPLTTLDNRNSSAIALGQDKTGRYYAIIASGSGRPFVYTSNDGTVWKNTAMLSKFYGDSKAFATFPMTLFSENDAMTLVFSDVYTGLQYSKIGPDSATTPDLVTQSALDTFAITRTDTGYITAQWKDDDIHIQQFSQLAFPTNPVNPANEVIYTERSKSSTGEEWNRIFARERFRVPDVTAIDATPDGHLWWGIETGIMALKGKDFFMRDVSEGFFYHFVDQITHCGDRVWFASSKLSPARVGFNHGGAPNAASLGQSLKLPELEGAVTAMACGNNGAMYFASAEGKIVALPASGKQTILSLPENYKGQLASLAYDTVSQRLLAGTAKGAILSVSDKGEVSVIHSYTGHSIDALASGKDGVLWAGVHDDGLYAIKADGTVIKHHTQKDIRVNLQKLIAGNHQDVWAIASRYAPSPGLIHADKNSVSFHNPPQKTLDEIIDFTLAEDGTLWIGTNLDGIYYYRSKE